MKVLILLNCGWRQMQILEISIIKTEITIKRIPYQENKGFINLNTTLRPIMLRAFFFFNNWIKLEKKFFFFNSNLFFTSNDCQKCNQIKSFSTWFNIWIKNSSQIRIKIEWFYLWIFFFFIFTSWFVSFEFCFYKFENRNLK